ncbi:TonB-dependent receptor [Polaribacter sp. 20A6]|uniref:SusC/RagA family TonB-linked outer membrane protein n=1 Tax=Polaribacter sp. 20A6 TaxID=2687289 RepID=UPI0013FD757C|nr:TonB-dependent receptor [Polaribacter sp. 20A6]
MKLNFLLKNKILAYSLLSLFAVLFCSFDASAQRTTINGTVTDSADNTPLPGVSVVVKGTKRGVSTDFDGNFTIKAKIGETLVFAYLGMQNKEVEITKTQLNISLDSDTESLEEIVVVGYGTVKKKELTGAVNRVVTGDIEKFVTPDVASALQGQVAGVNVTASSGEPGEAANIQIRGVTSLIGSNTPLFVVNGIPQIGDPGLSPNEIESIDILKDAASTAIYGARGAAGVILITTKQGKAGQMNVGFNYTFGLQTVGDEATPLMNTEGQLFYEVNRNAYTAISFDHIVARYPEWINNDNKFDDYVLNRYAEVKNYDFSVSGGAEKFTYNVVGSLFDQDGSIVNSNFKRYNGRASTTYNTDNWKIDGSLSFTIEKRKRSSAGLIVQAGRYKPYYPAIDPDEESVDGSAIGGVRTPSVALNQALRQLDNSNRDRINASLSVNRKLSESLDFITRVGVSVTNDIRNIFKPSFSLYDLENDEVITDDTRSGVIAIASRTNKFSWDASLNYKKKFGNHSIGATVALALEEDNHQSFDASIQGVSNNNLLVLDGGTINQLVNSGYNPDISGTTDNYNKKTVGTIGRLQYNYKGKYLVSALARYDGSSRFGSEYRWGTFPSISAAWNVSDEDFWEPIKATVNSLKVRLSHGTVGNDSFADYEYASTIAPFGDYVFDEGDSGEEFGTSIISYANADVKWETSVSNNVGVDLSFLRNKITVTADYYNTKKRDMLFPVTLPGSAGAYYDNILVLNIGDMENKGFEFATNYRGKVGESNLRLGATFTTNSNKITKMQDGVTIVPNNGVRLVNETTESTVSFIAVGREAGSFFLYETNGVVQTDEQLAAYRSLEGREDAEKGDLIYVDTNNDGKINNSDRVYKGSGLPDFEYGLNLNWNYKSFDLSMNWYGTVGAEVLNGNKAASYNYERHQDLKNMWTPNNPTSQIPIFRGDASDHYNYSGLTDYWLENGDYLRLKQISLGYTLSEEVTSKIGLDKFRFFLTAQNALTFTKYSGYDPEVGSNNVARRGIDNSRYPLAAIYSFGLNINF